MPKILVPFCAKTFSKYLIPYHGKFLRNQNKSLPLHSHAGVLELVDNPDLGSGAAMRMGSSPFTRTRSSAIRLGFFVYLPMPSLGGAYIADMGHGGKVAFDGFDMNSANIGHHLSGYLRII